MDNNGMEKNGLNKSTLSSVHPNGITTSNVDAEKRADSTAVTPSVHSPVSNKSDGSLSDNCSSRGCSSGDCPSGVYSSDDCPYGAKAFDHALHHVLPAIAKLGYEAFLVGGCVRDTLLQQPIHDVDIVTDCPPSVLNEHFSIRADVSKNMAVTVLLLQSHGYSYEVAQFRGEGGYPAVDGNADEQAHDEIGAGASENSEAGPSMDTETVATTNNDESMCRGPSCSPSCNLPNSLVSALASALSSNLHNDLEHRDFTLNALALDGQGAIIDPFGGREDISRKLIRAVSAPDKRIAEDPLRILRAIRFAVKYGFTIEKHTAATLQEQAQRLAAIAPERIQQELEAMCRLGGVALSHALQRMFDLGILAVILPEIANLNNFEHAPEHHPEGNAFDHTLACLQLCPSTAPHVLFAVLCHDIGKPKTFTMKDGRPAYHSHDRAALPLIVTMARRLRWSNTIKDHALFAAQQHMRFYAIPLMAAHKTFALMESPYFATLHTIARCDAQARGSAFDPLAWEAIERQIDFLRHTFMGENSPLQFLEGKRVMTVTGLTSGQRLGRIINKTKEWMLDNVIVDKEHVDKRLVQLAKSVEK